MKKIIGSVCLLFFLLAFSCTTLETTPEMFDAPGFTTAQLKSLGFSSIKVYTPKDDDYEEKTRSIRARYKATRLKKSAARTMDDPIPQNPEEPEGPGGGGGIYIEASASGRTVEIFEVSTTVFFSTVTLPSGLQDHDIVLTPRSNAANQPSFDYHIYNQYGLQGGSGPNITQLRWWDCVKNEYNNMCGGPLNELMCVAAGIYAPEVVLIVYAAWMLSCAW
jgi:hypothetical protein